MSSEPAGVDPTIAYFGDLFARLGIESCIARAVAANAYRPPRDTTDLDLVVQISADRYAGVVAALRDDRWEIVRTSPESDYPDIARLRHGVHFPTNLLLVKTEYQAEALERAKPLRTARATLRVLSAEDVIVHKLIANRHRDRADVHEILRSGAPLERDSIERWAAEWDVLERWRTALAEAGE